MKIGRTRTVDSSVPSRRIGGHFSAYALLWRQLLHQRDEQLARQRQAARRKGRWLKAVRVWRKAKDMVARTFAQTKVWRPKLRAVPPAGPRQNFRLRTGGVPYRLGVGFFCSGVSGVSQAEATGPVQLASPANMASREVTTAEGRRYNTYAHRKVRTYPGRNENDPKRRLEPTDATVATAPVGGSPLQQIYAELNMAAA